MDSNSSLTLKTFEEEILKLIAYLENSQTVFKTKEGMSFEENLTFVTFGCF